MRQLKKLTSSKEKIFIIIYLHDMFLDSLAWIPEIARVCVYASVRVRVRELAGFLIGLGSLILLG